MAAPRALPPGTDVVAHLLSLPEEERAEAVRLLGPAEAEALDRHWPSWAHEGQRPPDLAANGAPWSTCVVMGVRGFGKTLAGAQWIAGLLAAAQAPLRIALVGATLAEARSVMVEGRSGLLEVAGPWIREWRPSLNLLTFRTGAVATAPSSPHESTTFVRLVLALDPPSGAGTCGIVACALDGDRRGHVLADHSAAGLSPEGWARRAGQAAATWSRLTGIPAELVAESNQGGLMIQSVLKIADPNLKVKLVPAIQGKTDRAAPIAMLFEAGRVLLRGRWEELEAQLCGLIAGGAYEGPGNSPDRADAMVWALTELMLQKERAEPRIVVF